MHISSLALSILGLGALAFAQIPETDYDAIIVGGGPSGLAALSGLARVRRKVLLIDSGIYRNQLTRHVHDVIGFDGVTPAYLRYVARESISHYDTVSMINGTVTKIEPFVNESNNTHFNVQTDGPTFTARKIVLGTGVKDLLPSTPGIAENWAQGIYWCPWCDGHEHADQPLGILANLTSVPGSVREILSVNTDIIAFVNGTDTPEFRARTEASFPNWQEYLRIKNVTVVNDTLSEIERLREHDSSEEDPSLPTAPEFDLFEARFDSDRAPIERAAFFASFGSELLSRVGPDMGVRLLGGRLGVNESAGLITSVPGVYAVGDANSDNTTNVPHATFTGKRAAVYLHVRLESENALAEIAAANSTAPVKRDERDVIQDIWERMNDDENDILYAGKL